jgi:conflict system STAND superfamily ATPase
VSNGFQWPKSPYKGLSYYGPNDVPLFAGRGEAVRHCARQLAERSTRLLILQGPTGAGKSSFLRAGLIPFLEGQRGRFEFARSPEASNPEALFVRSTDSPLKALAGELYKFVNSAVIKTEDGVEKIDTSAALLGCGDSVSFVEKAGRSGEQLIQALQGVAAEWPRSLVLIIDQGEEVLTLKSARDSSADASRDQFFDFIYRFNRTEFDLKLILAIRSEYYGKFVARMGRNARERSNIEFFYLNELTESEIVEAIERPTCKKEIKPYGVPFEQYHFQFEPGLASTIVDDVMKNRNIKGGILPVVQIVCENLYAAATAESPADASFTITRQHYVHLPSIEVQLEGYLKQKLVEFGSQQNVRVSDDEVDRWKGVLSGLSLAQIDGTIVKQLKDKNELIALASKFRCKLPIEETMKYLSDPDVRVLSGEEVINSVTNEPVWAYSLVHDALGLVMESWKTAQDLTRRRMRIVRRIYLVTGGSLLLVVLGRLITSGFRFGSTTTLLAMYAVLFTGMGLMPYRALTWYEGWHRRIIRRAASRLTDRFARARMAQE